MTPNDSRLRRVESSGDTAALRLLTSAGRMRQIPPVTGIQAQVTSVAGGRNEIIVSWIHPMDPDIVGFDVWLTHNGGTFQVARTENSPAVVTYTVGTTAPAVLTVITRMRNGSMLDFSLCPTATVELTA